jgi:hypothetical protein
LHSTVIPDLCVIKPYLNGNYHGMKVNYGSIIKQFHYCGHLPWYFNLRNNKVKITAVIYCGIDSKLPKYFNCGKSRVKISVVIY